MPSCVSILDDFINAIRQDLEKNATPVSPTEVADASIPTTNEKQTLLDRGDEDSLSTIQRQVEDLTEKLNEAVSTIAQLKETMRSRQETSLVWDLNLSSGGMNNGPMRVLLALGNGRSVADLV